MIVDDYAPFRSLVRTVLQGTNTEFLECASGQEALAAYPGYLPDLVLIDIAMKDLDGLEATARLKSLFPTARIAILTEYDDSALREAAHTAGAIVYALKENLCDLPALLARSTTLPL